ncbi:MAG: CBS domain-containing protein [Candidatus Aenigmatarchaeota archaeon]|nr:MAG: CBS domain-containing protein [Candidatus Aenigmarchaeota archaeon]
MSTLKVKDIMKSNVITVDPQLTVSDAAKIMTNNRIGSVVVLDKKMKPVDIVTDDDIVGLIAGGKDPKKLKIKDIPKKRDLITTSPEDDVLKTTKRMIKTGVKRLPVIKDGKLQGIVSDKEILITAPELLEIMSEKLRTRVEMVAQPDQHISGICEECESYSDELVNLGGRWLCEDCREG